MPKGHEARSSAAESVGDQQERVGSCGLRPCRGWNIAQAARRTASESPLNDPAGPRVVQMHRQGMTLFGRGIGPRFLWPTRMGPVRAGRRMTLMDQRRVDPPSLARGVGDGRYGVMEPPNQGGQRQTQTKKNVAAGRHTGLSRRVGSHPLANLHFGISGVNGADQGNWTAPVVNWFSKVPALSRSTLVPFPRFAPPRRAECTRFQLRGIGNLLRFHSRSQRHIWNLESGIRNPSFACGDAASGPCPTRLLALRHRRCCPFGA
jgi:hypothetical protein